MPGSVQLALLRGVNVGGKNKLPMKDLAAIFEKAGCEDVRTFIQSGNVIFTAGPKVLKGLSAGIAAEIMRRFGYTTPVILRSAEQLRAAVTSNPFEGVEENLHVMFLHNRPSAQQIALLEPDRSPGDRFHVLGAEIYLHLPNGAGTTKLTNAWFDSRLATISTMRNWRTVTKLIELMEA